MSERAGSETASHARRGARRLGPALSWVLAALCCAFLLLYLAAQGRAITLMFRGFASGDRLSHGCSAMDTEERLT